MDEYFWVSNCKSAKEMWDTLRLTHEGTTDVKRSRIDSDTILEFGFWLDSTPKACSWGEGCPPLIYCILTLSLTNVGLGWTWIFPDT